MKKQILVNQKKTNEIYQKYIPLVDSKTPTDGITLIALVITILFSYGENLKCSNNKGFLLATVYQL